MAVHKIPPFLTKEFSKLENRQEKNNLLESYRTWKHSRITELFAEYLEHETEINQEANDKKFDFVSWFQKKEFNSFYKGVRFTLRKLTKQIGN